MIGAETLARFRDRIRDALVRDLELDESFSWRMACEVTAMVERGGADAFGVAAARLGEWDIAAQWRHILEEDRSSVLAEWVAPYVRGTVLDLLCGDGRVGERLRELGSDVLLCERKAVMDSDRARRPKTFVPFCDQGLSLIERADTVLVCTSAHGEEDPDALIAVARSAGARRLVLVENVVESGTDAALLALLGLFFHKCLGARPRPARSRHRTIEAWMAAVSEKGRIAALERKEAVPGVPAVHALLVVDWFR